VNEQRSGGCTRAVDVLLISILVGFSVAVCVVFWVLGS